MCEKLQKENTVRRVGKMGEMAMESQSRNANTATFRLRQAQAEVRIAGQALALY